MPQRAAILPPQLAEHCGPGWLVHEVVHVAGNTDSWRNDSFSPASEPAVAPIHLARTARFAG